MANKTATRRINLYLNGKVIEGEIKDIRREWKRLNNEVETGTLSQQEYNKKTKRMRELDGILKAHRKNTRAIGTAWNKSSSALNKFIGLAAAKISFDAVVNASKELFKTGVVLESIGQKARTVFEESLPRVEEEARKNAEAMGLTNKQYESFASNLGDVLKPMGFQSDEAAELSIRTINLSGAMAEWSDGQVTASQAANIFKAALTGEREQLKQLGIVIQEADIKARLAEKGLDKLTGQMLQQAKAAATLELIMEKSTDAQTAFANAAESSERKQAKLIAKIEKLKERLAATLLPIFIRLIGVAGDVADALSAIGDLFGSTASQAKKAAEELDEQRESVRRLEKGLNPLLERYEELTNKTELTTEEQEELKKIIKEIGGQVPFAAKKIDEYGNTLDINTGKTREFIAAQKLLVKAAKEEDLKDINNALKQSQADLAANALAINTARALGQKGNEEGLRIDRAKILVNRDLLIQQREQLLLTEDQIKANKRRAEAEARNEQLKIQRQINERTRLAQIAAEEEEAEEKRQKAAERAAKRRQKEIERELKAQQKKFEQLQEISKRFQEDNRLNKLSEEERTLAEIENKFDAEIEKAKELEVKKVEGATEIRLGLERQKEEALRAQREAFRLEEEEERKEFLVTLEQEVATDQERQFLQLEEHYLALIEQADKLGIDTAEIRQKWRDAENALADKFTDEQNAKREKQAKKELDAERKLAAAKIKVREAQLKSYKSLGENIKELAGENEILQQGIFIFEQGQAIAKVTIELQKELAAINAYSAALGPGAGDAYRISRSIAAKVRAGINIGVISATTISSIAQKKEGGWLNVRGEDDGKLYRAQYIGSPLSGMLPDKPVVLASEAGPEYFVSNRDLQNPKVLNYVQAIDNVVNARRFEDGGSTSPLPANPGTAATDPTPAAALPAELMQMIRLTNQLMTQLVERGVIAQIGDEKVIEIFERFGELDEASGGVLG